MFTFKLCFIHLVVREAILQKKVDYLSTLSDPFHIFCGDFVIYMDIFGAQNMTFFSMTKLPYLKRMRELRVVTIINLAFPHYEARRIKVTQWCP